MQPEIGDPSRDSPAADKSPLPNLNRLPTTSLLTLSAFAFLILKLLATTRFNAITALALVKSAGITSVLVGEVVLLLPGVLAISIGPLLTLSWPALPAARRPLAAVAIWASAAIALLGVRPWFFGLFFGLGIAAFQVWRIRNERRRRGQGSRDANADSVLGAVLVAYIATVVLGATVTADVWVSPEVVTLSNDAHLVGYVMGTEAGWTTILTDQKRSVLLVRDDQISSRTVCDTGKWLGPSVLQILFHSTTVLCSTLVSQGTNASKSGP
jgi:hypothetical protein